MVVIVVTIVVTGAAAVVGVSLADDTQVRGLCWATVRFLFSRVPSPGYEKKFRGVGGCPQVTGTFKQWKKTFSTDFKISQYQNTAVY